MLPQGSILEFLTAKSCVWDFDNLGKENQKYNHKIKQQTKKKIRL